MGLLTLAGIARVLGVDYQGTDAPIAKMEVDSRRIDRGDLFIATAGAQVDGHDYVAAAAERGAVAALVERDVSAAIPCLRVDDSLLALSKAGAANRAAYTGELVAITGSCGKTSVKNMCRAIFEGCGATVATAGNYNNEIGVPLTLSRLTDQTRYAVIEMGATGRGHIAHLCSLARPRISTVLNAMEAHLSGFGSVAEVADIKAEIFDGLDAGSAAILNLDEPWAQQWRERIAATGAETVTYSQQVSADVRALDVRPMGLHGSEFTLVIGAESRALALPFPGRHNVANALAAAAIASAAGISVDAIVRGLSLAEPEAGRLRPQTLDDGTVLIDDSYNANPGSVRAAIHLLAQTHGTTALVLGEMLELGDDSAAMHAEMGALAREQGVDRLIAVGAAVEPAAQAFGDGAQCFPDRDSLSPALADLLDGSDVILVKGSRGAAMEAVIDQLRAIAMEVSPC